MAVWRMVSRMESKPRSLRPGSGKRLVEPLDEVSFRPVLPAQPGYFRGKLSLQPFGQYPFGLAEVGIDYDDLGEYELAIADYAKATKYNSHNLKPMFGTN